MLYFVYNGFSAATYPFLHVNRKPVNHKVENKFKGLIRNGHVTAQNLPPEAGKSSEKLPLGGNFWRESALN
jgi:hypothetical protein